jgi:predicted AAA+ superfamily ATPase
MLFRVEAAARIEKALRRSPVTLLLGPRQCGKTTLARSFVPASGRNYFDLESPVDLARLDDAMTALRPLRGTVVIDEVQRRPEIFPILRVLADRRPRPARFLVLGSASPAMLRQSSESLAGRVELVELGPFTLAECGASTIDRRWLRGGFPRAFLLRPMEDSRSWRRDFLATLIERDLPFYDSRLPAPTVHRLWTMLAHHHGQVVNHAAIAGSLGISVITLRRHLDLLAGLLLVRLLPPWFENLGKRQVKSPRLYFRDTGLLHTLLDIDSEKALLSNPKCGASWESLAIEEVLARTPHSDAYWWSTHQGAELDLLLFHKGKRYGVEVKRADAPTVTPSMRSSLESLRLERITVVAPVERGYPLAPKVSVAALEEIVQDPGLVVR